LVTPPLIQAGFFVILVYLSNMKIIISESQYKLLIENNNIVDDESKYLSELENEISNLETEYSDIISKFKVLKDKIDEVKERKNLKYNVFVINRRGEKFVRVQFKYKNERLAADIMRFNVYDKLSDEEKKKSIDNRIERYLIKKDPLTR